MNVQTEVEKLILAEWGPMREPSSTDDVELGIGEVKLDPPIPAPDWFVMPTDEAWRELRDYAQEILSHGSLDQAAEARWLQLQWYAERHLAHLT